MTKTTSISLGKHFEAFVREQVKGGRFATSSEVIRAALRLLEDDEARLASLRDALEAGEKSGFVEAYALSDVLAEVRRKAR